MIWTILGISAGIAALFSITAAELLLAFPRLETARAPISGALALFGFACWFTGRYLAKRKAASASEGQARTFIGFDLRYWGPMLVALSGIALFIQPLRQKEPVVVHAQVAPASSAAPVIAPPEPAPVASNAPVTFPAIKLQGMILRGQQSVIIVDGKSFGLGEEIEGAIVKEITRAGAVLEKAGAVQLVPLEQ